MIYRIAICDDIKEFAHIIEEKIKNFFDRQGLRFRVDIYENGFALLRGMENQPYDIIFLDMQMPELNGIETGKAIREVNKDVGIIFVTGHPGYALESYKVHAFDYLLKPLSQVKMDRTLEDLLLIFEKQKEELKTVNFLENRMMKTIEMDQITYVEKEANRLCIHCEKTQYLTNENLSEFLAKLDETKFVRTHQGYVVHLDHIHSIQKDRVLLQNGVEVPISRKHKEQVQNKFFENLRR